MVKKIADFFSKNYFDKELPFEYRIYMIFFMECFVISILSATTNTLLQKGIFGIVLQWAYIAFCTVVLFIPLRVRQRIFKPLLLFTTLFYLPFLYFTTGGYDGTALMFALLGVFVMAIVFKGKQRAFVLILNIVIGIGCIFAEYLYPALVTPHGTVEAEVIDSLVALVLSATGLVIMTIYVDNAFELERNRISGILHQLSQSNNALAELTNRDALTGVYNRRFLMSFLERELKTAEQLGKTLCVLMLDIDHFKQVNDVYGHTFGDEVLVGVTKSIQSKLRKYDILARYGGEEFLAILQESSLENAGIIAERIREAMSQVVFPDSVRVTLSIGLVQSRHGETAKTLIDRADQCMYQAKKSGRNCVVSEGRREGHDFGL